MGEIAKDLKAQGLAILIMVGVAVISVLGMIILSELSESVSITNTDTSTSVNTTITAFIAGFAIVGTFAVVTMLMIVVKGILGVVKGLQS